MAADVDQFLSAVPLDVLAVGSGSVMGAVIGVHRRFALMGVIGLAIISGVGGGLVRDTLLQQGIPAALVDWRYGVAVLIGGTLGAFFADAAQRVWTLLLLVDSIALGLFAALGAEASLGVDLPAASAVAVGTTAAVGGWTIRDLVTGVIPPDLFKPGDLHGAAALTGCAIYVALVTAAGWPSLPAAGVCVTVTFLLRLVALRVHLHEPVPRDFSPTWLRAGRAPTSGSPA
jgi:uncharacterized membrane protein YeiH